MTWSIKPTITVAGVEYTNLTFNQVSIDYGRSKIFDTPRPGYARLDIANTTDTAYPFKINDTLVIELENASSVDTTIFTGIITDVRGSFRNSDTAAGLGVISLTAVAPMAQMSRIVVGQTAYPSETDAARIQRILTEAGVTIDVIDSAIYTFASRPAGLTDAFTLANNYASSVLGAIYETTDGKVGYANESRRNNEVNTNGYLTIPNSSIIINSIYSNENIADVMNLANVSYSGGTASDYDTTSQSTYGVIGASFNTELNNLADAETIAATYINLRSLPRKNLSSFGVRLLDPTLSTSLINSLLGVYFGMPVEVPGLPNSIVATDYQGYVEGWNLSFSPANAVLTLKTSEEAYSYRDMRWQDVDPTVQWEDLNPTATRSTKTNLILNPSFEPVDYGKLGYIYLPGVLGYGLETPDAAALDITGDIDIRVKIAPDDWTPAATQAFLGKDSSGNRSYIFGLGASGALALTTTANGTTSISFTSTANLSALPDGTVKWVRVTLDVDNGAGGKSANFYTSDDGSLWTQLGTTVTSAGTTSIFSGSANLTIGQNPGSGQVFKGKVYAASIRNGINGTEVFQFDVGGNWKSTDIDSFTAQTAQTVTLSPYMAGYGWGFPGTVGTNFNFSRSTAQVSSGVTSGLYTAVTTGAGSIVTRSLANLNTRIPVANGDTIYFAFKARRNVGTRNARARIFTYNSTTSSTVVEQILGSTITLSSTAWTVCQVSGTLTNANSLFMDAYIDILAGSANESLYVDAIIVEKNSGGYAAYYFDGSYSDIPTDRNPNLAWSGTANFSTSTANAYWGTKPTTLWNNVDEQGIP